MDNILLITLEIILLFLLFEFLVDDFIESGNIHPMNRTFLVGIHRIPVIITTSYIFELIIPIDEVHIIVSFGLDRPIHPMLN